MDNIFCITIDGESGTGKSTITGLLANKLQLNILPSGCIYRWYAWCLDQNLQHGEVISKANLLSFKFDETKGLTVLFDQVDITQKIICPSYSQKASNIATSPFIRKELLPVQQKFLTKPGLIAEGRDMSSVVFPNASLNIYLTTSIEIRAKRRYKQLLEQGISVSIDDIKQKLKDRDLQDKSRSAAPLRKISTARVVDTGQHTLQECVEIIYRWAVKELNS